MSRCPLVDCGGNVCECTRCVRVYSMCVAISLSPCTPSGGSCPLCAHLPLPAPLPLPPSFHVRTCLRPSPPFPHDLSFLPFPLASFLSPLSGRSGPFSPLPTRSCPLSVFSARSPLSPACPLASPVASRASRRWPLPPLPAVVFVLLVGVLCVCCAPESCVALPLAVQKCTGRRLTMFHKRRTSQLVPLERAKCLQGLRVHVPHDQLFGRVFADDPIVTTRCGMRVSGHNIIQTLNLGLLPHFCFLNRSPG